MPTSLSESGTALVSIIHKYRNTQWFEIPIFTDADHKGYKYPHFLLTLKTFIFKLTVFNTNLVYIRQRKIKPAVFPLAAPPHLWYWSQPQAPFHFHHPHPLSHAPITSLKSNPFLPSLSLPLLLPLACLPTPPLESLRQQRKVTI